MITTKQMRALEEQSGVSKLELMERAGRGIAAVLKREVDEDTNVLFVCYHGNNGGDGFTAARYLKEVCNVNVLFVGEEQKLKKEARVNYEKLRTTSIEVLLTKADAGRQLLFDEADIIIDCLLGIGVRGEIKEPLVSLISQINVAKEAGKRIIAVDVPTGINPDTGEKSNAWIEADVIITVHDIKPGLEQEKCKMVDIGL